MRICKDAAGCFLGATVSHSAAMGNSRAGTILNIAVNVLAGERVLKAEGSGMESNKTRMARPAGATGMAYAWGERWNIGR